MANLLTARAVYFGYPETMGVALEEMDQLFGDQGEADLETSRLVNRVPSSSSLASNRRRSGRHSKRPSRAQSYTSLGGASEGNGPTTSAGPEGLVGRVRAMFGMQPRGGSRPVSRHVDYQSLQADEE